MESEILKWVFEQGSIVVSFAIGTGFGFWFTRQTTAESTKRLVSQVQSLREHIKKSDDRCEREIAALQKRLIMLEDSRAFILQNSLRSKS